MGVSADYFHGDQEPRGFSISLLSAQKETDK